MGDVVELPVNRWKEECGPNEKGRVFYEDPAVTHPYKPPPFAKPPAGSVGGPPLPDCCQACGVNDGHHLKGCPLAPLPTSKRPQEPWVQ